MNTKIILVMLLLLIGAASLSADVLVVAQGNWRIFWWKYCLKDEFGGEYGQWDWMPGSTLMDVDLPEGTEIKAWTEIDGVYYESAIVEYHAPLTIVTFSLN